MADQQNKENSGVWIKQEPIEISDAAEDEDIATSSLSNFGQSAQEEEHSSSDAFSSLNIERDIENLDVHQYEEREMEEDVEEEGAESTDTTIPVPENLSFTDEVSSKTPQSLLQESLSSQQEQKSAISLFSNRASQKGAPHAEDFDLNAVTLESSIDKRQELTEAAADPQSFKKRFYTEGTSASGSQSSSIEEELAILRQELTELRRRLDADQRYIANNRGLPTEESNVTGEGSDTENLADDEVKESVASFDEIVGEREAEEVRDMRGEESPIEDVAQGMATETAPTSIASVTDATGEATEDTESPPIVELTTEDSLEEPLGGSEEIDDSRPIDAGREQPSVSYDVLETLVELPSEVDTPSLEPEVTETGATDSGFTSSITSEEDISDKLEDIPDDVEEVSEEILSEQPLRRQSESENEFRKALEPLERAEAMNRSSAALDDTNMSTTESVVADGADEAIDELDELEELIPELDEDDTNIPTGESALADISEEELEELIPELDQDDTNIPATESAVADVSEGEEEGLEESVLELDQDDTNIPIGESAVADVSEGEEEELEESISELDQDDTNIPAGESAVADVSAVDEMENGDEDIMRAATGPQVVADSELRPTSNVGFAFASMQRGEVRSIVEYMDQLLDELPQSKIEEFANSQYFEIYQRLFKELGINIS